MVALTFAAGGLGGCAALALPVVGTSIAASGAGSLVKAGTEYTASGVAYRTFTLPLAEVRSVTLETLGRLDLPVETDEAVEHGWEIKADASRRAVQIRLERLSDAMTRLRLVVKRGVWLRDRSTASEILAQIERTVADHNGAVLIAASSRTTPAACACP